MKVIAKVRSKVDKQHIKTHLSAFQKELRRQMVTFITGAFSFVAALLWRDAIQSMLTHYENAIQTIVPIKELWVTQFFVAFFVTILAVIIIYFLSKLVGK